MKFRDEDERAAWDLYLSALMSGKTDPAPRALESECADAMLVQRRMREGEGRLITVCGRLGEIMTVLKAIAR